MENATVAAVSEAQNPKPKKSLISWPLFKQSLKANKTLLLIIGGGMAVLISIINIVIGKNTIFSKIDMNGAQEYMDAEGLTWLKVLGLLQAMNFSTKKIAVMSQLDMSMVMDSVIYGLAHMILPMLFVISVSNSLIAVQVDNGSMAYVLSTPTNRKQVVTTQALFLFGSLTAIYLFVTGIDLLTKWIGYGTNFNPLRTFLLEFGSYSTMFALAGVAFMASCLFSRARESLAMGGGLAVWCFLAAVLGLFGTNTFVSLGLGVEAMRVFNFTTLYTLFDTESIDTFAKWAVKAVDAPSFNWIWELAILFAVGIVSTIVGMKRFEKKDLVL